MPFFFPSPFHLFPISFFSFLSSCFSFFFLFLLCNWKGFVQDSVLWVIYYIHQMMPYNPNSISFYLQHKVWCLIMPVLCYIVWLYVSLIRYAPLSIYSAICCFDVDPYNPSHILDTHSSCSCLYWVMHCLFCPYDHVTTSMHALYFGVGNRSTWGAECRVEPFLQRLCWFVFLRPACRAQHSGCSNKAPKCETHQQNAYCRCLHFPYVPEFVRTEKFGMKCKYHTLPLLLHTGCKVHMYYSDYWEHVRWIFLLTSNPFEFFGESTDWNQGYIAQLHADIIASTVISIYNALWIKKCMRLVLGVRYSI